VAVAVAAVFAMGAAGAGGTATGQFTVSGKAVTFASASAKATPDTFDSSKTGYTLILSDVKGLPDPYGSIDKVAAGTLHYIELTIGHEKQVYGAMLHHHGFKNDFLSKAGGIKLEVQAFGPDVLAGKVYMGEPGNFDGTTYQFTATFKTPIAK
jgi:hypothetical protein